MERTYALDAAKLRPWQLWHLQTPDAAWNSYPALAALELR
jgi:hypothetical protein